MRLRMLTASLAVATATATALIASPAQAVPGDCPAGGLCAYTGQSFSGTRGTVYANNTNLLQYYAFNNAESVANNGNDCNVRIYSGTSYTGSTVTGRPGSSVHEPDRKSPPRQHRLEQVVRVTSCVASAR